MTPADEPLLREAVETLAAIERPPTSEGERRAARWLCTRLQGLGCAARVEEERAYSGYAKPIGILSALGAAAGAAAGRGHRLAGMVGGLAAAAGIAEDISNGPRVTRRLVMRRRPTWNVVAEAGDRSAERTLVVLAHHDAPQTGLVFHPAPQRKLGELAPDFVERTDTSIPLWWPVIAGPLGAAAGAALGSRALLRLGTGMSLLSLASFVNIARSRAVPAANDNATGVAGLVALAAALERRPVAGLRVMLVSCGSEESLQGGIHGFAARHFDSLPTERTFFLNLETIGSPRLALLEGEGPVLMRDFRGDFKDLVCECAEDEGLELRRGLRSRSSTDSVVPHRAGYPVATLISVTAWKALANYHWPTDTPANVDYTTTARAVRLAEAVARRLARAGPTA